MVVTSRRGRVRVPRRLMSAFCMVAGSCAHNSKSPAISVLEPAGTRYTPRRIESADGEKLSTAAHDLHRRSGCRQRHD